MLEVLVDFEVYPHVGSLRKRLVTRYTLVRFLSRVCPHVFLQSCTTVERLVTM